MALPAKFRLKKRDIAVLFRRPVRFRGGLGVIFKKSNDLDVSRFGFSVSTKAARKAHLRNEMRRLAGEWVRQRLNDIDGGYDLFVVFGKEAAGLARKKFYEELEKLFLRAGVFKSRDL